MERSGLRRELFAEFLGTFTLMIFGLGVNAQVVLGQGTTGTYLSINFGWGLAVMMGIYVSGGVSGAHLNPAVTIALTCLRKFPIKKVVPFILIQVLAAFVASAVIYSVYFDALAAFEESTRLATEVLRPSSDGHLMESAGIWSTYPSQFLNPIRGGLIDQFTGTALLVMMIFAMSDERNTAPDSKIAPITVGAIVLLIGMTFGLNCGYAINPARDFGPRLFTYFAGWGGEVFRSHHGFWWVPIVGPIAGGIIGGLAYDLFVTKHHPQETE